MLTNLIVLIMSQYICISNHQVIHLKFICHMPIISQQSCKKEKKEVLTTKSQLFCSSNVIASSMFSMPVHAWKQSKNFRYEFANGEVNLKKVKSIMCNLSLKRYVNKAKTLNA